MTTSTTPILQANALHASYGGTEVLRHVDLSLQPGEMVGLLGPNGSGKSTLLRVLSGLLAPKSGSVTLAGMDLHSHTARQRARLIGLVPQYAHIPFAFSVTDVVAMGRNPYLGLLQGPGAQDQAAIAAALERTDCLHLRERLVTELSGGELQRVIIARALAQEPRVLLLDEPTAHLDLNHQLDIANLLRQLNREQGLTVLWVSHDLNLAAEFCERLVMLKDGKLVADGTPDEVITPQWLADVYGLKLPVANNPASGRPQVIIQAGAEK
ncbi:MAG: heme ABC transporter ATP-binding protein [Armatimonadota bacterium]